jgi:GNAT superfamily N-acetyltransferase
LKILSVLGFSKAASKSALHASSQTMYAYLAGVFIIEEFRGRSLATWLMECIVSHPSLQGLRRWTLATRDAHRLYAKYGFTPVQSPGRWMERHDPDVYLS